MVGDSLEGSRHRISTGLVSLFTMVAFILIYKNKRDIIRVELLINCGFKNTYFNRPKHLKTVLEICYWSVLCDG